MQLHRDELVTIEVQHQENYPSRKVYTITDKGLSELRDWVLSSPQLPELRNSFLIQLAWADQLDSSELASMLEKYEYEVQIQLIMCRERIRRQTVNPARTERETYLWSMIFENWLVSYESELAWVQRLHSELSNQ